MAGCGREEVGRARSLGAPQGIEPLALALPAGLQLVSGWWVGVEESLMRRVGGLCPEAAGHLGQGEVALCALPGLTSSLCGTRTHAQGDGPLTSGFLSRCYFSRVFWYPVLSAVPG